MSRLLTKVGAFGDGLPRTKPFEQVTPLHADPDSVQNPVDHLGGDPATCLNARC